MTKVKKNRAKGRLRGKNCSSTRVLLIALASMGICNVRGSRVETHPKGSSVHPSMQGEKERRAPTHNGFSYLQPAFLIAGYIQSKSQIKSS
jgi:hypothetical protein